MHFPGLIAAAFFCCLALTACGGGGGGATSTGSNFSSSANTTTTVSGKVTFDLVPIALTGSQPRLDYTAIARRPARSVIVEAVDSTSQAVLATTSTNAAGDYTLAVPGSTTLFIRALAKMNTVGAAPAVFSVVDNTSGGAQWAIGGAVFASGAAAALTQDLNAGSGWTGTAYDNARRAAGPFAILDTVHDAALKIVASDAAVMFPALDLNWSPNNIAASGSLTMGQIGTSFFSTSTTNNVVSRRIYVLGAADNDTDEYDRHVVAHEFGHYLQNAFSRDDSIGGAHGGSNDRLDMRVAFSEGWGNAWSAIALNDPIYSDTNNRGQASGGSFDVSVNDGTNPGWFKEPSVQKIFWDLASSPSIGFTKVWLTLRNGLKSNAALTSIHSFARALTTATPTAGAATAAILAAQSIALPSSSYADNETNFSRPAIANLSPIYLQYVSPGSVLTNICTDSGADAGRSGNKAGEYRYVRLTLPQSGSRTFTVSQTSSSSGISDPDFVIYGNAGSILSSNGTTDSSREVASSNLAAGEYVMVITDYNLYSAPDRSRLNSSSCFTLTIQ